VYGHAIAARAFVEAARTAGGAEYRAPAQKALDFIALARNPGLVWRYAVKPGDNDTSLTGWMGHAILSAMDANRRAAATGQKEPFSLDAGAAAGIHAWLAIVTDPATGKAGYITQGSGPARPTSLVEAFPAEKSEAMTAVALALRLGFGEKEKTSRPVQLEIPLLLGLLPTWKSDPGTVDFYYWYYGTVALRLSGGKPWAAWKDALRAAVIDHQRKDGPFCFYRGSWDPSDPWGADGGRVYSTAIVAMALDEAFGPSR